MTTVSLNSKRAENIWRSIKVDGCHFVTVTVANVRVTSIA